MHLACPRNYRYYGETDTQFRRPGVRYITPVVDVDKTPEERLLTFEQLYHREKNNGCWKLQARVDVLCDRVGQCTARRISHEPCRVNFDELYYRQPTDGYPAWMALYR